MIRVEITSTDTRHITGTNDKGKKYDFYTQTAWAHLHAQPYPTKTEITLDENKPYPVGNYMLAPQSIEIDQRSRLSVRPVLIAQPAVAAATTQRAAG